MSVILVLNKGREIHAVTDGACYTRDGRVSQIQQKINVVAHLKTAVFTRGPAGMAWEISLMLSSLFSSFDHVVDRFEPFMRKFYEDKFEYLNADGNPELDVTVLGWSDRMQRTDAYTMRCYPQGSWAEGLEGKYAVEPFKPVRLTSTLVMAPGVTEEELQAAQFPIRAPETFRPELDLLHLFEILRRQRADKLGNPNEHEAPVAGGFAMLTSITKDEVRQRTLARYPEDVPGQAIQPLELDWGPWRAGLDPSAMSRLRRAMAERRDRKRKLLAH